MPLPVREPHAQEPIAQTSQPGDADLLLSAFRKVAAALDLTLAEQAALLGVSRATIAGWKASPGPDPDKLDRMALVVAIHGLAGEAFPGDGGAEGWLRRPNLAPPFLGEAPLDLLLKGRFESLLRAHDHLQALVRVW
ncbi:antitoxin Xre-like helix-turn-helix domain-containing protein [Mesoterricola sediminis]|uniref:Antitoxin Xre-like helix-turn-helix domain-containing protein n=1 Tax=Mesoterricola sediminis TaxID=2927980 RepID=A0AA48KDQ8_9BACT|nr:antitoxin Xre-like helix-turn-helix domain-containing protein [Mesoterricola sediminis]BDU77315.1 hypothetical protein METESE_22730 [Mesoterricola sediminis]